MYRSVCTERARSVHARDHANDARQSTDGRGPNGVVQIRQPELFNLVRPPTQSRSVALPRATVDRAERHADNVVQPGHSIGPQRLLHDTRPELPVIATPPTPH
jgi:hypothetical protein